MVKRTDPAWKIFEREISALRPLDMQARLGLDVESIRNLRRGSQRPPFAMLPTISSMLDPDGDPTLLARRMGLVPDDTQQFVETIRLRGQIRAHAETLSKAERRLAEAQAHDLASLVDAVGASGDWAIAVWPGMEGPGSCRIRDHDRIDIRRTDGRLITRRQVHREFADVFDVIGVQSGGVRPRWAGGPAHGSDESAEVTRWVLPRLAREVAPQLLSPFATASVTVLSTSRSARPEAIGALLARALGYGFTSAGITVRQRSRGGEIDDEALALRAEAHRRWAAGPLPGWVWANTADARKDGTPTGGADVALEHLTENPAMLVIWCDEQDAALDQRFGGPRSRAQLDGLVAARDRIRQQLDRLPAERLVRLDVQPHSAPVDTPEAADQKMTRSLDLAAAALQHVREAGTWSAALLQRRLEDLARAGDENAAIARYLLPRVG